MKLLTTMVMSLLLFAWTYAQANSVTSREGSQTITITRSGSQPSKAWPRTLPARYAPTRCSNPPAPARARGVSVTFEPGARKTWHTHPLGQTLIVTAGCGLVQSRRGPVETIRPGDMVWIPPGQKHWHGATGTTAMTHIAIVEHLDGKSVEWMEKVTDEEYKAGAQAE